MGRSGHEAPTQGVIVFVTAGLQCQGWRKKECFVCRNRHHHCPARPLRTGSRRRSSEGSEWVTCVFGGRYVRFRHVACCREGLASLPAALAICRGFQRSRLPNMRTEFTEWLTNAWLRIHQGKQWSVCTLLYIVHYMHSASHPWNACAASLETDLFSTPRLFAAIEARDLS